MFSSFIIKPLPRNYDSQSVGERDKASKYVTGNLIEMKSLLDFPYSELKMWGV